MNAETMQHEMMVW